MGDKGLPRTLHGLASQEHSAINLYNSIYVHVELSVITKNVLDGLFSSSAHILVVILTFQGHD